MSKGTFVVLIGPDGTGKSTISAHLQSSLANQHTGTFTFHWRPGLVPKPGKKNDSSKNTSATTAPAPPTEFTYGYFVSLLRYLYYLIDFTFGYWIIIKPKLRKGYLVIGERWYYDILIHPQRYAFRLPQWLMKLGGLLVPTPDNIILLYGDPVLINARKPELSAEAIAKYTADLESLLSKHKKSMAIATDTTVEESTHDLDNKLRNKNNYWSVYPSIKNPRVFIHQDDTVANALKLIQAYTLKARLFKTLFTYLPNFISKALLTKQYGSQLTNTITSLKDSTVEVLPKDSYTISAYIGSDNINQKITLQICNALGVYAYAKCGKSTSAITSLKNESDSLKRIAEKHNKQFLIPKVIATTDSNSFHTIIETPNPDISVHRGPVICDLDISSMIGIASFNQSNQNITSLLDKKLFLNDESIKNNIKNPRLLEQATSFASNCFYQSNVIVTAAHGDYAPWNTLSLPNNQFYIFDWEYYDVEYPALFDYFHFIYMSSKLLKRLDEKQVIATMLKSNRHCKKIADSLNITNLTGYAILYLLAQLSREFDEHNHISDYTMNCIDELMNL